MTHPNATPQGSIKAIVDTIATKRNVTLYRANNKES